MKAFNITIINDEISEDLDETIQFLKLHQIDFVELRTIKKKNLIDYSATEARSFYAKLHNNNIKVSALASPLFKWYPHRREKIQPEITDTFGFSPFLNVKEKTDYIEKAIAVAKALGTKRIRIFSSLTESTRQYSFIDDKLFLLALDRARKEQMVLLLENEPPCYVNRMKDIQSIASQFLHKNLGIWFDLANFYKVGEHVTYEDLQELKESIQYFHLKDFDEAGNYVPLGNGIINYRQFISYIKKVFKNKNIFLSIETHARTKPEQATLSSLLTLRNLLAEEA